MAKKPKGPNKKGGKGKIIIILVVVLVLLGGGFFGLAFTGVVKVPGITPKSKLQRAQALYGEKKEEVKPAPKKVAPKPSPENRPATPPTPAPKLDMEKGAAAVAEIWNALPPEKVVEMSKDWSDEDLARVLALMEIERTASILSLLPPKKASDLSERIQRRAATPPEPSN